MIEPEPEPLPAGQRLHLRYEIGTALCILEVLGGSLDSVNRHILVDTLEAIRTVRPRGRIAIDLRGVEAITNDGAQLINEITSEKNIVLSAASPLVWDALDNYKEPTARGRSVIELFPWTKASRARP